MLRNRELRVAVWISLAVMLITACLLLQISTIAMLIALFSQGLLLGIYLLLSQYRYTQLKTLSMYLQQVYQGDGALDIPQYKEGELSILHSDLYKITRTLQLQKESLQKDKLFLADSLSDISHQLKTPLTSMMVMSELLKDEHLSKEQHDQFVDAFHAAEAVPHRCAGAAVSSAANITVSAFAGKSGAFADSDGAEGANLYACL